MSEVETHPVQTHRCNRRGLGATGSRISTKVTMRAYEVYERVCGKQAALVTGECRGGFGVGELIAFLYARSFPEKEWRQRFDEAIDGMLEL